MSPVDGFIAVQVCDATMPVMLPVLVTKKLTSLAQQLLCILLANRLV
jgi:hypothetical protein